ncbi:hypothetical protein Drorol1_Dr00020658 [Drosera rotundifolia]
MRTNEDKDAAAKDNNLHCEIPIKTQQAVMDKRTQGRREGRRGEEDGVIETEGGRERKPAAGTRLRVEKSTGEEKIEGKAGSLEVGKSSRERQWEEGLAGIKGKSRD